MALPAPNLDDRTFQSLVDDAKRMVQQRCPEWTDHNVSDPGVTLIETFAYLVEQLLYRLNRLPERTYLKFLDLLGVRLQPPRAARAPVTFWLSAPQERPIVVPAGTQVATRRTDEEAVVFTTTEELTVVPCALDRVASEHGGQQVDQTEALLRSGGFLCFASTPQPGDCFYVGLTNAIPRCIARLRVGCRLEGSGVDPRWPPITWEAWDGARWSACEVIEDGTGGLNRTGDVVLHLPREHRAHVGVVAQLAGWLRCRVLTPMEGQPTYEFSPRITRLSASTVGGTTDAVHADVVRGEVIGPSSGVPAQRFPLAQRPVVPGHPSGAALEVWHPDGGPTTVWHEVDHFGDSGPDDHHFVLDALVGEVVLGPAVREPDGSLRRFGAVPEKGAMLRVPEYRTGGGRRGNVARGAISVLKSSVPFIARVENRRPASGGTDAETVENAKLRGPLLLRTRHRAVTAADYEHLALDAAAEVARARCVPAGADGVEAGAVRVLLVPAVEDSEHGSLDFARMEPSPEVRDRVVRYLDERRVAGARLAVEPAGYVGLTVVATLRARPDVDPAALRVEALEALYGWFHPLRGGLDGTGWPFGRTVVEGDAYGVLQRLPGVELVEQVRLFPADPVRRARSPQTDRIALGPNDLVFPWGHQVLVRS